jgi:hypothetical protein
MRGRACSTTSVEEVHATELSAALVPPDAPCYHKPWGLLSTLLLIAVLLFSCLAVAEAPGFHCIASGQRTVCSDGRGGPPVQSAPGITPDPIAFARWVQRGLVALPICMLAGLLAQRWRVRVRSRRHFQVDYQLWQQANALWADLQYCHRCDGVFTPGARQLLSLAEWSTGCQV